MRPTSPESRTEDHDIGDFLLRACHDIRTPLRNIRAHSERLLKEHDPQSIRFVVDAADKIDRLLDGLAAYSIALQIDPQCFQPARLDVLLRNVLANMQKDLRGHGAEVVYSELPCVRGNADRLMQVFENLTRNALEHHGTEPLRISISAERQADTWRIALRDNGRGLAADHLEKIFRPFERLCPAENSGPGLGLAICRAIIERHGGRIWAESEAGGGAAFLFELPGE